MDISKIIIKVNDRQTRKCRCYTACNVYFTIENAAQARKYAKDGAFTDIIWITFAPWVSKEETREILKEIEDTQ